MTANFKAMTMAQLVDAHNDLHGELIKMGGKPTRKLAKKSTFSSKAKAIAAIKTLIKEVDDEAARIDAMFEEEQRKKKAAEAKKTKPSAKKPAIKKTKKTPTKPVKKERAIPRGAVKQLAEKLLLKVVNKDENEGLPYDEILNQIRAKYPTAKTSNNCLRWYANKMRANGVQPPYRPRSVKKDPMSGYNFANAKIHNELSEETTAFSATIVTPQGNKIKASNKGRGGADSLKGKRDAIEEFSKKATEWTVQFGSDRDREQLEINPAFGPESWVNYMIYKTVKNAAFGPKGYFKMFQLVDESELTD